MGAKSRENGNKGERIIVSFFRDRHYWVHATKRSASGAQPVDVIAIRGDGSIWLVDAKYVDGDKKSFPFDDIQPNQRASMRYASEFSGIQNLGFAIMFNVNGDVPMFFSYWDYIDADSKGKKSVNIGDLRPLSEICEDIEL